MKIEQRRDFHQLPITCLITKGQTTVDNFSEKSSEILSVIESAVAAEISLIQIREKNLPAKLVFELSRKAAELTRSSRTKLLINDRADIALAAFADGVHLTSNSITTCVIRSAFPKNFIIGASAHSLETAESAKEQGADFVVFAPVFETPGKGKPQGLKKLREICEKLHPFPVLALGGVNEANYKSVLENGASGFAAIRFLNDERNLLKLIG